MNELSTAKSTTGSPIRSGMAFLEKSIETLNAYVESLETRLTPIMSSQPPSEIEEEAKVEETVDSELSGFLHVSEVRVNRLNARLQVILERLAL